MGELATSAGVLALGTGCKSACSRAWGMNPMQGDVLYRVLARALDVTVWGGDLIGSEHLPESGSTVFVSNHASALGPIAVAASLPLRLHMWIVADMLDRELAPAYLEKDFIGPVLHVPVWISLPAAQALSQITVRLLRRLGCIPVWTDKNVLQTYRLSEECLALGRSIAVFPEDPTLPADETCGMRPFKTGFARLGQLHYARTQKRLRFYPVAVLLAERKVRVGAPIEYNPLGRPGDERTRIGRLLEDTIRAMVMGDHAEVYGGVSLTP